MKYILPYAFCSALLAFCLGTVAAYVTHLIVVIAALVGGGVAFGYGVLLFAGTFIPPIGIIHGVGVWFGAW